MKLLLIAREWLLAGYKRCLCYFFDHELDFMHKFEAKGRPARIWCSRCERFVEND